jgi:hypothetical protein
MRKNRPADLPTKKERPSYRDKTKDVWDPLEEFRKKDKKKDFIPTPKKY